VLLPAFALDAMFAWGKLFGPAALTQSAGYVLVFSRERLLRFQTESLSDLSLAWHHIEWPLLLAIYGVALGLALYRRQSVLWFCFFFVLLTPLPIEFLEGRSQATLFIPAVGWAVFAAVVFVDLAQFLGSRLAYEVGLRGLLARAVPLVLIAGALWWWIGVNLDVKKLYVDPAMAE